MGACVVEWKAEGFAARLVRADSGFVIWTETMTGRFDDIIMVQDDIAAK